MQTEVEQLQDCLAAAKEAWALLQPVDGEGTDPADVTGEDAAAALSEALAAAQRRLAT